MKKSKLDKIDKKEEKLKQKRLEIIEQIKIKEEKLRLKELKKIEKQQQKDLKNKVKNKKEENNEEKTSKKKRVSKSTLQWTKYYKEGVKSNLHYPKGTMVGYLLESVARYPESIAIEYYGRTYTYRYFYEMIKETAKSLKAQGVKENDKIAIFMPNTPQALMMFYAANMIGAISCLIHPLSAENEIQEYLNKSEVTFLLTIDLVYEKIHNIIDKTNVNKIVVASVGESLKNIKKFLYKFRNRGTTPKIELSDDIMTWKEFLNYGYDYEGEIAFLKKETEAAVILYSGGTSGKPKGIVLSNLNFNALALTCHLMIEQSGHGQTILAILPIFHGFGLGVCIHTPLCCGMKVVLIPKFAPKDFGKLLHKHKISLVCAVPSLYESLSKTKLGKSDLSNLKCAISGGDFMSKDLKESVDKFFENHASSAKVRVGYGLTEASAAICVTPTDEYRDSSIGIPFPDTLIKIVKIGTHQKVKEMEDGEICISGPTIMMGYLNEVDESMHAIQKHEDGKMWLHTGDVGCMDKDGFIYFKQRVKRIIVSNGYNIYPSYVETIINSHPHVYTSTVIGVAHPKKGQAIKAFIVLNNKKINEKEALKEIKIHCEKNLSKYSLPLEYEFIESMPKTLVGKVAYKELEKTKE